MEDSSQVFSTDDVAHEADLSTPLQRGMVRYVPSENLPANIKNSLPAKNDRPFVYVPVGYLHREKDTFMKNILSALGLDLPNIVVVTAETTGSAEEQIADSYGVQNPDSHPVAQEWEETHTKEVLAAKVGRLLESVMESSMEVGAWLLPDCPRRRNGAAQMICEALPSKISVALGLIGLNEDEADKDFKESIEATMVPIGSPVQNVCKLTYDVDLKDGAPCPQLSHLLIFDSPEEKNLFREALLDLVPDFMVAFGNITKSAMENVFNNAKSGSPVVLLKHTSKNVDSLCRMFKHVNKYMKAVPAKGATGNAQSSAPEGSGNIRIPPIENEEDDLIRLFINTWPPGFNSQSVVLSDPLIMTATTLQKRLLGAITAAFDLKTGNDDTRLLKRKALNYAWSFLEVSKQHSLRKKTSAEILHIQLVFFTLLSIVASVIYDQVYGGQGQPNSAVQLIVYVMTILLPLYITSLKQESDKGTALTNWGIFTIASYRIESEILKFRTQVGKYRVEEKSEIALQKPVKVFARKIQEIWVSVKSYLQEDGMVIPGDFWSFDPDTHLAPKEGDKSSTDMKPSLSETTPFLPPGDSAPSYDTNGLPDDEEAAGPKIAVDVDTDDEEDAPFIDDKFSPMKADDYIECRMQIEMQKQAGEIQEMVKRNQNLSYIIKIITICSGGAAALSLQWCVPIVLGVTAALGTAQEFRKYPRRIEQGNSMVVQLNELKLWWMGLSLYQKQLPHNKDHLILTAERVIITALESNYDGPSASKEDN